MPAIAELLAKRAGIVLEAVQDVPDLIEREVLDWSPELEKRVYIPCCNASSPPGLVEAVTVDPWTKSGKYALAWVYFSVILLVTVSVFRWWHYWNDKMRTAIQKEKAQEVAQTASPQTEYDLSGLSSSRSTRKFFPKEGPLPGEQQKEEPPSIVSRIVNSTIALCRFGFYRPVRTFRVRKGWRPIVFPSLGVIVVVTLALALVVCYTFIPQPLFWQSIRFGSPPVAIRSGMLSVAMMPWIIGLSMKANVISIMTGIGHERLNVLHRWAAYICLLLALIHTIPFYITPVWDRGGYKTFQAFFANQHFYVYGTGEDNHILSARRAHANDVRCRCSCSFDLPLPSFTPTASTTILRTFCHCARACVRHFPRHALLALPQLSHILELFIRNSRHLALFLHYSTFLPQLDQPIQDVMADWRGGCSHSIARECPQSHSSYPGEMETWTIRLPSNARRFGFREPSIHNRLALQRRLSICVRRAIQRYGVGVQAIRRIHQESLGDCA